MTKKKKLNATPAQGASPRREIRHALSPKKTVQFISTEPSMTKQEFKSECDINKIMDKYQHTGAISHFNKKQAQYEFHTGIDFHTAMNQITEAQNMFDDLPSSIRQRFGNDPGNFVQFVENPENLEELEKMGLAITIGVPETPPKAPEPTKQGLDASEPSAASAD